MRFNETNNKSIESVTDPLRGSDDKGQDFSSVKMVKDSSPQNTTYAEDTPLTWILGNHPEVKLVSALLSERDQFLNKSDMARMAGINRNDVYSNLDTLCNHGIVAEEMTVGDTDIKLYKFADTEVTIILKELEAELLRQSYKSDKEERVTDSIPKEQTGPKYEKVDDPYAEDTPLTWIFGDHPEPKLLSAILSERNRELNISDWARVAGVSRGAVYNHINNFIEHRLVVLGQKIRNSQHYRVNMDNPVIDMLLDLESHLLKNWFESK